MGFIFDKVQKSILEVLNGTDKEISANIDLLAKDYTEKTGRKVCRTCPSDIQYMILSLKNFYKMTQFKFKRHAAMYKNKKGDKTTISNGNLTDEKAIEFLQTNPERIVLFSEYPSNWETLLLDGVEAEADKEARLAAEAEAKAAAAHVVTKEEEDLNNGEVKEGEEIEIPEDAIVENEEDAVKEATEAAEKAAEDAMKPKREELERMSLKDLRAKFPDIKATSKKDFIDKVLA